MFLNFKIELQWNDFQIISEKKKQTQPNLHVRVLGTLSFEQLYKKK